MFSKLLQCSISALFGLGFKDGFSCKMFPQATRFLRATS